MPQQPAKPPNKSRSAAAKKAAATRRAHELEEQAIAEERDRYKTWEDRFKSGFIFLFGALLAVNEFLIEPKPRELAIIFAGSCMTVPFAVALGGNKTK